MSGKAQHIEAFLGFHAVLFAREPSLHFFEDALIHSIIDELTPAETAAFVLPPLRLLLCTHKENLRRAKKVDQSILFSK